MAGYHRKNPHRDWKFGYSWSGFNRDHWYGHPPVYPYPEIQLTRPDTSTLQQVAVLRSYVTVVAIAGYSLGAPLGGFLADLVGWRM